MKKVNRSTHYIWLKDISKIEINNMLKWLNMVSIKFIMLKGESFTLRISPLGDVVGAGTKSLLKALLELSI